MFSLSVEEQHMKKYLLSHEPCNIELKEGLRAHPAKSSVSKRWLPQLLDIHDSCLLLLALSLT